MLDQVSVADKLKERFPDAVQETSESHGELTLVVSREQIVAIYGCGRSGLSRA
jgi:D-arabinose 5-phosphate isomerase GutQ